MLTFTELRQQISDSAVPMTLWKYVTDPTPADAAWFRELGAGEDCGLLMIGSLFYDDSDGTWDLMNMDADFWKLWRDRPPTRGQVVCLLLSLGDAT